MNIRVNTTDRDIEWIEQSISNLERHLVGIQVQAAKDTIATKAQIEEIKKFWETNTLPIYHQPEPIKNLHEYYSTVTKWRAIGKVSLSSMTEMSMWCCKWCNEPARTTYVEDGSGHRDYAQTICNCEGARKHGTSYTDLR